MKRFLSPRTIKAKREFSNLILFLTSSLSQFLYVSIIFCLAWPGWAGIIFIIIDVFNLRGHAPIMSQCVPSWDHPPPPPPTPRDTLMHHLPMLGYEVAELTWENGQLGMQGHGHGSNTQKPSCGTLESIVKQATCKGSLFDAMVPCDHQPRASCTEAAVTVPVAEPQPSPSPSPSLSVSGSATFGRDPALTLDTYDELGGEFTSTTEDHESLSLSMQSTPSGTAPQKKRGACDEVEKTKESCGKSSISTKRSRAAAIHNQSERKRRDKINQRMKTLQKLVPNSSKTDKASMLDEVIDYLKQLQAQVQMMTRFNFTPMNMMQQMPFMTPMGMAAMGMGMGLGLGVFDMAAARPFIPITPPPAPADRMPDPLSAFLASHSHQPMSMDAYSRLQAAMYQQMQQNPAPSSSNN